MITRWIREGKTVAVGRLLTTHLLVSVAGASVEKLTAAMGPILDQ